MSSVRTLNTIIPACFLGAIDLQRTSNTNPSAFENREVRRSSSSKELARVNQNFGPFQNLSLPSEWPTSEYHGTRTMDEESE